MKHFIFILFTVCLTACASQKKKDFSPYETGYIPVNGIQVYYEMYGKKDGVPLVLLPGGGSTINASFKHIIPHLAKYHRIIAMEEQGHGRTSDRHAPVSFETTADDVAGLVKSLGFNQVDIFGFSNGASSGLQVAIRHPEIIRKLVFASSITKKSGAYPWFWEYMKKASFENMPKALKDEHLRVNPDPVALKVMHDKDADRMKGFKDTSDSDVKKVKAKVLIMCGDRELVRPEHAVELTHLIKDSRLLILPGGHGDYMEEIISPDQGTRYPEYTAGLIHDFLGMP